MNHEGQPPIAPGSRILVRDCEWLVRRVDRTSTGGQAYSAIGISELVRDKESVFLSELETPVVLDPVATQIVVDSSPAYRTSLLYIESQLRQTAPTDDNLYIGHKAAMDPVPYQLDPAMQALAQPRPRILIADAVGLGKTLECGILLSELIRRGRGKRILVLTVKSMLTQFQKELWSRFCIPLTRLDSVGIRRVRQRIPTNHNPFYYFDKSIISIDTLKQDAEYRTYLENAYWDVIVVDEAQNVAERGKQLSLRAKLAKLLASRSDALIMLSATPHDGRARSFASLMNMLDPTAIADRDNYTRDDIKGLFIRRFKKDIQGQVQHAFKQRKIATARARATTAEERAYRAFTDLTLARIDQRRVSGQQLFKTTLEKGLFSSPQACTQTLRNRAAKLKAGDDRSYDADIGRLEELANELERIDVAHFAKYQKLLEVIRDKKKGFGWTGRDPADRLVIFTERIRTMELLASNLKRDLKLTDSQVMTLSGEGVSDVEQQHVVEEFGKDNAKVRLLIASDVASEGINLHYLCHRMIHFDIPWSLMVFKQRNGRIDRYGQTDEPHIVYLVVDSENPKIKGDARILELLIEKDQQAVDNIGDPSTWMGVYDIDTEELITGRAMDDGKSAEELEAELEETAFDPLAALMASGPPPAGEAAGRKTSAVHTLFADDYAYLEAAITQIQETERIQVELVPDERRVELTAPADLEHRFRFLPPETWPEDGGFHLSASTAVIEAEVRRCREDEKAWPRIHYLWPLHPVLEWANDRVLARLDRHQAPLITLPAGRLPGDHIVFLLSGLVPNRKSHPLLHVWFGVTMQRDAAAGGTFVEIDNMKTVLERTGLGAVAFANTGDNEDEASALQVLLPEAISQARAWMSLERDRFEADINRQLNEQLEALEGLRKKQYAQLELRFEEAGGATARQKHDAERREIDRVFDEFIDWVQDTMTTEDNPYIKVVAVLRGSRGAS